MENSNNSQMKRIGAIINKYNNEAFQFMSHPYDSEKPWADNKCATLYLSKYLIDPIFYRNSVQILEQEIFKGHGHCIPNLIFNEDYIHIPFIGGGLFNKVEFNLTQRLMQAVGDNNILIVEQRFDMVTNDDLHFIFPPTITWEEINSGSFVSDILLSCSVNNYYYLFGDKGVWGKYNSDSYPNIDIYGIRKDMAHIFSNIFGDYFREQEKILKFDLRIPEIYRSGFAIF